METTLLKLLVTSEVLDDSWFIAAVATVSGLTLIICLIGFLFIKLSKPTEKFLSKQDLNNRIVRLDYDEKNIYLVDSKEPENSRSETYEHFLKSFSTIDARKLDAFFDGLFDKKNSSPTGSFFVVDAHFSKDKGNKYQKSIIIVDSVNVQEKTIYFTSSLLPNITRCEMKQKNRKKYQGYMDYEEFLLSFRGILSRYKQAVFYLVTLKPIRPEGWNKNVTETTLYQLIDKVCLNITENRYIIKVDGSSFLFVDLNEMLPEEIESFGNKLFYDCESFLSMYSKKEEMITQVGVTMRKPGKPISPLKYYIDNARSIAVSAYEDGKDEPVLYEKQVIQNSQVDKDAAVDRILKNKTWRINFTPFFNIDNSEANNYFIDLNVFGEKDININEFLLACMSRKILDDALEEITESIERRIPDDGKPIHVVLPVKALLFHECALYFAYHPIKKASLSIGVLYSERSITEHDGLKDNISMLNEKGIEVDLIFRKLNLPSIPKNNIELFDGFILLVDSSVAESRVNEERILLFSLMKYLESYDKKLMVLGVGTLEQLGLVAGRGADGVTCYELENASSRLETPTEQAYESFKKNTLLYPSSKYTAKISEFNQEKE